VITPKPPVELLKVDEEAAESLIEGKRTRPAIIMIAVT